VKCLFLYNFFTQEVWPPDIPFYTVQISSHIFHKKTPHRESQRASAKQPWASSCGGCICLWFWWL